MQTLAAAQPQKIPSVLLVPVYAETEAPKSVVDECRCLVVVEEIHLGILVNETAN